MHDFIGAWYETSIIITKPLSSSTFQWAMQLSKQSLLYLGSTEVLVYPLPAEHTEVILDFITVPCFILYIQPLKKSEKGIISKQKYLSSDHRWQLQLSLCPPNVCSCLMSPWWLCVLYWQSVIRFLLDKEYPAIACWKLTPSFVS